jgi:hypothetical protein
MSTNIPMARVLLQAALQHNVTGPQMRDLIRQALGLMTRKRVKKVTAAWNGKKITPEIEEAIWRDYMRAPEQSILALAIDHEVNPGRVSEIIARRSM